jgi:hypothetical protein
MHSLLLALASLRGSSAPVPLCVQRPAFCGIPRSKHDEAQIITALKQAEAGRTAEDVARDQQAHDLCLEGEVRWDGSRGGIEGSVLEEENNRLKRLWWT